jgi:hypothetical protein
MLLTLRSAVRTAETLSFLMVDVKAPMEAQHMTANSDSRSAEWCISISYGARWFPAARIFTFGGDDHIRHSLGHLVLLTLASLVKLNLQQLP